MNTDGTETQTDVALEAGDTETPKEETQFTLEQQAQVDKQVRDAKTSVLADVGRSEAEAKKATKSAQRSLEASTAALERTKQIREELDAAELEAAKGNSEQLSAVEERQKRRKAETDLVETKLELSQKDEELSQITKDNVEATKDQTAREIATSLGVDADRLIRLSKLTDGSAESIKAAAKELPKQEIRPPVEADSSESSGGGGGTFTLEQINNMPDDEYLKNKDAIDKARMGGKIKR